MTISLHTGTHTATVSSEWTVWDTRCRLVVTDPWAMHKARHLLEEQLTIIDRVAHPKAAGAGRRRRGGPVGGDRFAELLGRTSRPRAYPYGLVPAPEDVDVHQPAPEPWQLVLDAAARGREALLLERGASLRAWTAQLCAELVAEVMSCGVLVAFGSDVATSGLAPVGGWRIEIQDAPDAPSTVVAVDGGGISRLSTVRVGQQRGRSPLRPVVVPATGRTVPPSWRSVSVAAADAPAASAACAGAMLRGPAAPGWLAELGLPALLVDIAGAPHCVGRWPVPA
jgi:thiamine biosynthesis lipoprotein